MTTSKFDQQVLIEQLRYIEAQDALIDDNDDLAAEPVAHRGFSKRLWLRANSLIERNDLTTMLHRPAKLMAFAQGAGLVVAALLGALAAAFALSGTSTINIYWLLLVLLGFNLVSMLLWLLGIGFKFDGLTAGILAKLSAWIPAHFKQKSQNGTAADRAWLSCHFGGRVGKWQLSSTTHLLWLVYLFAGLAFIVLVLMARQYEFVWGTTLLSDSAFVNLTEVLGGPLQVLGLTVPTAEQVQLSRVGVENTLSATFANSWAQFLLGALTIYGILPRLLLWLWSKWMLTAAKRNFKLDYYLPYYIDLRQKLFPQGGQVGIDDAAGYESDTSDNKVETSHNSHAVPSDALWVAVELDERIQWPPAPVSKDYVIGQVNDRESLARVVKRLETERAVAVAVAVAAARVPDRGVQRTISSVFSSGMHAAGSQFWLVLLHHPQLGEVTEARLAAWYRLAEACGVPADHVVLRGTD